MWGNEYAKLGCAGHGIFYQGCLYRCGCCQACTRTAAGKVAKAGADVGPADEALAVESRDSGGVLLLSDSPEYLAEYGIL